MAEYSSYDIMAMVISFFLPPVGVFMKRGCSADLCINICLTVLGHIPGIIHAFYIIYKYRNDAARVNNPNNPAGVNNPNDPRYSNPTRQYQNSPSVAIPIDDNNTTASRQNDKSSYKSPEITQVPMKGLQPPPKYPENVVPASNSPSPHYGTHTIDDSDPNRYKR